MPYSMNQINQMTQAEFVTALGDVFEDTPAIAQDVWKQRPFKNVEDLHQRMVAIVQSWDQGPQLALVQAHPDLGSKAKMAAASVKEQASAGLDQLSAAEYEQFHQLNTAYRERFGFPFIIAVKNHTKTSILEAFCDRLHHTSAEELQQALQEIAQIAYFRLCDRVV